MNKRDTNNVFRHRVQFIINIRIRLNTGYGFWAVVLNDDNAIWYLHYLTTFHAHHLANIMRPRINRISYKYTIDTRQINKQN